MKDPNAKNDEAVFTPDPLLPLKSTKKPCQPEIFEAVKGQRIALLGPATPAQKAIVDYNDNNGTLSASPDPDNEDYCAWLAVPAGNTLIGCSTGEHHHVHREDPTPPAIAWQYPVPSGYPRIARAQDMEPCTVDESSDEQ